MTMPAVPAATLVLFRPAPGGVEVLMIERSGGMRFAAGALVFPGGRIDPGDHDLAATTLPGIASDEAAARVAAIRETIEEVGIAVGLVPAPDRATTTRLRGGLAVGGDFAALLAAESLRIDAEALTPFARWQPDARVSRRFDTRFFLAEAPADAEARPDGSESVAAFWATPRAVLEAVDGGQGYMIFPTRRNVERLATLESIDAARAHAGAFPVTLITPYRETRDGEEWLCIPEGCGYPITAERLSQLRRG